MNQSLKNGKKLKKTLIQIRKKRQTKNNWTYNLGNIKRENKIIENQVNKRKMKNQQKIYDYSKYKINIFTIVHLERYI